MVKNSLNPALSLLNISKFDDDNDYLANITCSFMPGTRSVIVSKEAAARRVLFRIAAGLDKALGGDVQIFGKSITDYPDVAKTNVFLVSLDLRFHLPATISRLPDLLGQNFSNWSTKSYLDWTHRLHIPMRALYSELPFETQMRVLTALAIASGLPLVLLNDVENYLSIDEVRYVMQDLSTRDTDSQATTLLIGSARTTRWIDESVDMISLARQQIFGVSRDVLREKIRLHKEGLEKVRQLKPIYASEDADSITEFTQTRTVA